jgi:hypothetical protein
LYLGSLESVGVAQGIQHKKQFVHLDATVAIEVQIGKKMFGESAFRGSGQMHRGHLSSVGNAPHATLSRVLREFCHKATLDQDGKQLIGGADGPLASGIFGYAVPALDHFLLSRPFRRSEQQNDRTVR